MTFMESAIAINSDFVECHNSLGKIGLFAEASYSEYQINLKEIALKVLKESGTEDDYIFLATEAAKDYAERAKKTIEKIIETIVTFIRNCKNKLIALFTGEKATKTIDKAESACEKNPKLCSKKIEYADTERQVKTLQKGIDTIKKNVAKVESRGYATEDDLTSLDDVVKSTTKKIAVIGAISGITIGAATVLLKKYKNKDTIETELGDEEGQITQYKDGNGKDPITASFFVSAAQNTSSLLKEKVRLIMRVPMTILNKLDGKVLSDNIETEDLDDDADTTTESVNLEDLDMFKVTTEASSDVIDEPIETESAMELGMVEGLDLDVYFTELCNDLFTESEDETTTESMTTDNDASDIDSHSNEHTDDVIKTESTDDSVADDYKSLLDEMESLF